MTLVWHEKSIKIPHKSPQDFSITIQDLKAKRQYEIGNMKVSRENLIIFGYDVGLKNAMRGQY